MKEPPTLGPGMGRGAPHLTDDQCLDLLRNLLPEEERESALAHLAACPDCEQLFQGRFAAHERLLAHTSAGEGKSPALPGMEDASTDGETLLLMGRFYEDFTGSYEGGRAGHRAEPMSKVAALQETKRWLRTYTDERGWRIDHRPSRVVPHPQSGLSLCCIMDDASSWNIREGESSLVCPSDEVNRRCKE